MKKDKTNQDSLPVEGLDFAKSDEALNKKQPSHGEVANQKDGDFSELEKSRMENPPQHRVENGSGKADIDSQTEINQSKGVK